MNVVLKHVLLWMFIFLGAVVVACAALAPSLEDAFASNPLFNAMILLVLLSGIAVNLRQVLVLNPELGWIDAVRSGDDSRMGGRLRLVAPLATMLSGYEREGVRLSVVSMRSVLEGIRLRLDESRDISRYMTGLLIFLGLLGTFWGLLDTVSGVTDVISGIAADTRASSTFDLLKNQLRGPLSGMATAFSSSLFGLGGALILGFVDIQAGHAQNRFYNNLEEWLSELTHLPSRTLGVDAIRSMPGHIEALLEQTADNLHNMQRVITQSEGERRAMHGAVSELTNLVSQLADQLRSEQKLMVSLTKSQMELQPALSRLASTGSPPEGLEAELRDSIRGIEHSLMKFREESAGGREYLMETLQEQFDAMRPLLLAVEGVDADTLAAKRPRRARKPADDGE